MPLEDFAVYVASSAGMQWVTLAVCVFAGLGRRVRRQAARRLPVWGRRQSRTLGRLNRTARGRGRRSRRRRLLALRGGGEASVPPTLVRRLVRSARYHPRRERQVVLGAGRSGRTRLLRRPCGRSLRFAPLLPREAVQDDEPMRVEASAPSSDGGPVTETLGARLQHPARHRARDGARERRGSALRAGVRNRRRGALRAAERARPGSRARHPLPRAAPAGPRLRLRRRGTAHHRLGLRPEPIVEVGARPPRGCMARRLGLERGQLRAASGADELVHGARAGRARAPLSACDSAGRAARWGGPRGRLARAAARNSSRTRRAARRLARRCDATHTRSQ